MPAECYRIGPGGAVEELYGGIEVSNGIGLSPDGATLYHVDSTTKGIWVHDLAADGTVSNRRHIGRAAFERGIPDGMCVDVDGNLWVAHVGGRRVVKLSPSGDELDEIPVPAKAVTSVAFGGPDAADMYIVTADHLDEPDRRGLRVPLPARRGRSRDAAGDRLNRWNGARASPRRPAVRSAQILRIRPPSCRDAHPAGPQFRTFSSEQAAAGRGIVGSSGPGVERSLTTCSIVTLNHGPPYQ